jgi:hypothetical protein
LNVQELAEGMRERQRLRAPSFVAELASKPGRKMSVEDFIIQVNRMHNREMIESYITCSYCGTMECSYEKAIELGKYAANVDEWLGNLEAIHSH